MPVMEVRIPSMVISRTIQNTVTDAEGNMVIAAKELKAELDHQFFGEAREKFVEIRSNLLRCGMFNPTDSIFNDLTQLEQLLTLKLNPTIHGPRNTDNR